jgi:hypothetical protein
MTDFSLPHDPSASPPLVVRLDQPLLTIKTSDGGELDLVIECATVRGDGAIEVALLVVADFDRFELGSAIVQPSDPLARVIADLFPIHDKEPSDGTEEP